MIVPTTESSKLARNNDLHNRTFCADSPDTSEIEKMRPIFEHILSGSMSGNSWRECRRMAYIERPDPSQSRLERQAVSMHHEENRDFELLKADIASRLRSACAHFPEREFAELVHQIASIELKYSHNPLGPPIEKA